MDVHRLSAAVRDVCVLLGTALCQRELAFTKHALDVVVRARELLAKRTRAHGDVIRLGRDLISDRTAQAATSLRNPVICHSSGISLFQPPVCFALGVGDWGIPGNSPHPVRSQLLNFARFHEVNDFNHLDRA